MEVTSRQAANRLLPLSWPCTWIGTTSHMPDPGGRERIAYGATCRCSTCVWFKTLVVCNNLETLNSYIHKRQTRIYTHTHTPMHIILYAHMQTSYFCELLHACMYVECLHFSLILFSLQTAQTLSTRHKNIENVVL